MIWPQILAGWLISGAVFLRVNGRPIRSRAVSLMSIVGVAVAITVAIVLQVPPNDSGPIADVAKIFLMALALSIEGFFGARWMASTRLPAWARLLLYLPIVAIAGLFTMTFIVGFADGS
jgi:hypothetical protein